MASKARTVCHDGSVSDYIAAVPNPTRRADALTLLKLMQQITGKQARMWGSSIIGFDSYSYRYESGHSGEICMVGFAPRSASLVLYVLPGFVGQQALLDRLGKHRTGKGCLYINKLADIDPAVLELLIRAAYSRMRQRYG